MSFFIAFLFSLKMSSKRKIKKARNDNWIQLKSILWKEFKDTGYEWNSKKFNQLTSETYKAIDKKDPTKVARVGMLAHSIEETLQSESIGQTYQIPYYELSKTLEAFRDDPVMGQFTVVTNFNTSTFSDEKFKAENFEYSGSQFQALVQNADAYRMYNPKSSPPAKIVVEVDPKKKRIKLYIGEPLEEPTEIEPTPEGEEPAVAGKGKGKKPKKPKVYKLIRASSPEGTKKLNLKVKDNDEKIKDLDRRIRQEKDNVIPLLRTDPLLYKDFILLSTGNIKEWTGEFKKLTKENEDLKKQLKGQDKGFTAKKTNKRKR